MRGDETESPLPIDVAEAGASLSFSDVNLTTTTGVDMVPPIDAETEAPLPIDAAEAGASMSFSDVNLKKSKPTKSDDFDVSEHADIVPPTDEFDQDEITQTQKNGGVRRGSCVPWCVVGIVGILVFAVGLGLGLGLKGKNSKQVPPESAWKKFPGHHPVNKKATMAPVAPLVPIKEDSTDSPTEAVGTEEPTEAPRPSFKEIVDYLSKGVSDEVDLLTEGSPQNQAARWMAEEDGLALALPSHVGWRADTHRDAYMFMFRYVMALNYFALDGPNWLFSLYFLSDNDTCDWNGAGFAVSESGRLFERGGVICDADTLLPTTLDLEFNNMTGTIPKENGLLGTLELFDMEHNNLEGEIPKELCNLHELEFLLLKGNNLEGELPSCHATLKNLEVLRLDDNNLSGELPEELCSLYSLEHIVLDNNLFSGKVPSCISALSSMTFISLSNNYFKGEIPDFSGMTGLKQLYLDGNKFSGNPAQSLNNLENLEFLYLEENNFQGDIHSIARDMPMLRVLDLSSNSFTSQDDDPSYEFRHGVPRHLFTYQNLTILDLSNNQLEGSFPDDIPVQDKMVFLSVHENKLTGPIPSGVKNLIKLLHLDLASNDFDGDIPSELFDMPELLHLFLSENPNLSPGPIPDGLQDMTQLTELSLKNTGRTGPLPELIGFDTIFLLDLDSNNFEGTIPENYGNLRTLRYLLLNGNPLLGGTMPFFNETNNLNTVLVDGTGVTGDFSSICDLPAFTGRIVFPTDSVVLADCSDSDSGIDCDCCHCCSTGDDTCTDTLDVSSLDWDWANGFRRTTRDFGLDLTSFDPPDTPIPQYPAE